jgi:K+ transporter
MVHTSDKTQGQIYIPVVNWIRKLQVSLEAIETHFAYGHQL